jgi:hypothetical protein
MRPGHVQVQGAFDVNVPGSRVTDAVDTAATLTDRYASDSSYRPTEDDQRRALGAAVGLGLAAPGVNPDLMLRLGLFKDFDAGIRYSALNAHVDGKYRFLTTKDVPEDDPNADPGFQGAVSLGVSKSLYSGLVFDALEFLDVGDYSRWNVEVPVIFGKRMGNIGHVWFGPKYVYSHYSVDASLRNVGIVPETSGSIHHLGAFGGVGLGYKWVFVFTELTVANMFAKPEILGQTVNLGGIVIVPALGLMLRI